MVTVPSHLPRRLPPAIGPRLVIAAALWVCFGERAGQ